MEGSGGLFLAGGAGEERKHVAADDGRDRRAEEGGLGGRELSGARWAICTIRVKIRSATGNLKPSRMVKKE